MSSERESAMFRIGQWVIVTTTACNVPTEGYIVSMDSSCIGIRFDGSLHVEQLVPRSQITSMVAK